MKPNVGDRVKVKPPHDPEFEGVVTKVEGITVEVESDGKSMGIFHYALVKKLGKRKAVQLPIQ